MITSIEKNFCYPKNSSAYHEYQAILYTRVDSIRENIADAKGFLYGSASNTFFTLI